METPLLSEAEKRRIKSILHKKILEATAEICNVTGKKKTGDHDIGWIPDQMEEQMTDAAFAIIDTVNRVNNFMDKEKLLEK